MLVASAFCLTPSGDTPKRRGFFDAIFALYMPVLFGDRTSECPWYLSPQALADGTVLLEAGELKDNRTLLHEHLRALLPQAPAMRATLSRVATSLQYSYSDMGVGDHAELGPDAFDVALYHMTAR
jgi:hypothetical protein